MAAEFSCVVSAENVNDLEWFRPFFIMCVNEIEMDEYESANIKISFTAIQEMLSFDKE